MSGNIEHRGRLLESRRVNQVCSAADTDMETTVLSALLWTELTK